MQTLCHWLLYENRHSFLDNYTEKIVSEFFDNEKVKNVIKQANDEKDVFAINKISDAVNDLLKNKKCDIIGIDPKTIFGKSMLSMLKSMKSHFDNEEYESIIETAGKFNKNIQEFRDDIGYSEPLVLRIKNSNIPVEMQDYVNDIEIVFYWGEAKSKSGEFDYKSKNITIVSSHNSISGIKLDKSFERRMLGTLRHEIEHAYQYSIEPDKKPQIYQVIDVIQMALDKSGQVNSLFRKIRTATRRAESYIMNQQEKDAIIASVVLVCKKYKLNFYDILKATVDSLFANRTGNITTHSEKVSKFFNKLKQKLFDQIVQQALIEYPEINELQ